MGNQEWTIKNGQSRMGSIMGNQEWAIKNGQSRETGNNGYRTKTNKVKNTTQKTKKMSNTDPTKNQG